MTVSQKIKPDASWIRARQKLLKQLKVEVARRLGPETEDLRGFRRRYLRELSQSWEVSTKAELLSEVELADIVYGGDFHAAGQAQRTHLRILRSVSADRPVILALECFARHTQKWLDLFSAGSISLDELRRKARWERSWGFPWDHYKPLLELAKRRGFRLIGLNEAPGSRFHSDLAARERHSAECLRDVYRRFPGSLIYVIFGDLHLADRHLPRHVRELAHLPARGPESKRRMLREVVIHLNAEKIYFQLAKKGLELTVDVVKFGPGRFCVMSSPPWVQWQSYLLYLDHSSDLDLDRDEDVEEYDPTDQVAALIRLAASDLKLAQPFRLDDLSVYSADDNAVWGSLERNLKPEERNVARQLLASGRSFFLPQNGIGYLARATINHAASLAGQYIHARLAKRKRSLWRMPGDFSALIWAEAAAYYISKLINHKRRAETLGDLKAQLALSGPADQGHEAMKLAMDRLLTELILVRQGRKRAQQLRPRRKASYLEAARILGGMMGERLYLAHRSRKIDESEIVRWMKLDVTRDSFHDDYVEIIRKLGSGEAMLTQSRRERL